MEFPDSLKPILNRLLNDEDFRRHFLENPEEAARELGFTLSEDEISLLRTSAESEALSEIVEERLLPSACMIVPWGFPLP